MVDLNWNHFGPVPDALPDSRAFAEHFYHQLKTAFPDFVADFEAKFGIWQRRWFERQATHPAPTSVWESCELTEYDAVLMLGPKTIPLVVHELCNPDNLFATVLYNHLETNPSAKIDPNDVLNYLTLNRQANLIVDLNHERARRAQERIEAWRKQTESRQKEGLEESGTTQGTASQEGDPDTSCAEYAALVDMGPGIVAQVMLSYAADKTGSWWKVMHRLVCEEEAQKTQEEVQYERWREWFEDMEYYEAKEGLNPEYLRRMGMQEGMST